MPAPVRLALLCSLFGVAALVGCGEDGGEDTGRQPSTSAPAVASAAASSQATAANVTVDDPGRTRRRPRAVGKLTLTPVADFSGRVAISYRDGLLAVAVGGPEALQLRVGRGTALPQAAPGAGPIPVWARIHVGSNSAGTPVVTYPRCASAVLSTCDIHEWNTVTRRERPLPLASDPGRAELEASESWGDVVRVVSRTPQEKVDHDALLEGPDPRGAVWIQRRNERANRLVASGGYGVDYNVGKVGLLQYEPGDPCGIVSARLFQSRSERRTLFRHRTPCDQEEGGEPVGAAIAAGQFMFGFSRTYEQASVFAHPINAGPRRQQSDGLGHSAVDYAPVSGKAGYVVDGTGCDGRWDPSDEVPRGNCSVDLVTGLDLR